MNWLFTEGLPLPAGLTLEALAPAADGLGDARIRQAEALLGKEKARGVARKLGPYALEGELANRLGLEGVELGHDGEVEALTPARWGTYSEALSLPALLARLQKTGGEPAGLLLTREQSHSFLEFLSRHRINTDEAGAERIVELARHFFFGQPINVVVRYTATVRADS